MTRITSAAVAALLGLTVGAAGAVAMLSPEPAPEPVCHAVTEDSRMTDCDYRAGAWHMETETDR